MRRHRGIPEKDIHPIMRKKREWYKPVRLLPFDPDSKDKSTYAPRFATIDIETQDWINYVCGEVYWISNKGAEGSFETNDISKLMVKCFEIAKVHRIKNFVAHFGGKFDFLFFIRSLLVDLGIEVTKIIPRGSSLLSFKATMYEPKGYGIDSDENITITFRDSAALLPFGLGSLTKSFGVETLKGEMDFLFVQKVYNNEDYLEDILKHKSCVLFYKKKQITKLTKQMRLEANKRHLRYWNFERFSFFPYRGKKSFVRSYMVKKDKKGNIVKNDWFHDVTFPIFEKQDLLNYLHSDCKGLYQCIDAFFKAPLISSAKRKWTTASQAVEVFRLFMKHPLHSIPDSNDFWYEGNVDEFVRKAYFGGRTEIFKPVFDSEIMKKDWLYYYDVNSLYPYCMQNFPYGDRFLGWIEGWDEYEKFNMAIWHCKVRVPKDMYIPVLAKKVDERLVFPVGEFTGYWTKYELEYAKEQGCEILELYEGAAFEEVGYIFKEFIKTLYQMRLDAKEKKDNVTQLTMKLIMNSCYGRMGINKHQKSIIIDDMLELGVKFVADIDVDENTVIRLSEKGTINRSMFSNPFIACMVTSYARVHLHKQMMGVGGESVYYCDSVTKDRMVTVRDRKGMIAVKSFDELWSYAKNIRKRGEKEIADLPFETLSWDAKNQRLEYRPIKNIIRHKTDKKIYRVRSSAGLTCVTEDHSLIDKDNNKLTAMQITELFTPKVELSKIKNKVIRSVDMHELLVADGVYDAPTKSSVYMFDDEWIYFKHKKDIVTPKIKRFWNEDDLYELMVYLAFFVGDGSVSTLDTNNKHMASVNSLKYDLLESFRDFMMRMSKDMKISITTTGNKTKCKKINMSTMIAAYFFRALVGQGARNKTIPDFIYNLPVQHRTRFIFGLLYGDGCQRKSGNMTDKWKRENFSYTTTSDRLCSKLSVLFSMQGISHGIYFNEGRNQFEMQSNKENRPKKLKVHKIKYDDYVYDLSVAGNENFFDAMGMVGLHNTDSVFSDKPMHVGKELGAMKLEYKCQSSCFLLPKTYVNTSITLEDGDWKPQKLTMKGFDYKNIRNVFTINEFLQYLHGEVGNISVAEKPKFATFKTALRMGEFLTMKNDPKISRAVDERREAEYFAKTGKKKKFVKNEYKISKKTLQGHYNKRTIIRSGFETKPLLIEE